jgi:hypothetical protein
MCVNDEDIVTLEDKNSVHPFEYFGWIEGGKCWWMLQISIVQLFREELNPVNPFTKIPFSAETRARVRELNNYRFRNRLPMYHTPPKSLVQYYSYVIYQYMQDFGYEPIHPEEWNTMSPHRVYRFYQLFCGIMNSWALQERTKVWRRQLVLFAVDLRRRLPTLHALLNSIGVALLNNHELSDVIFLMLSARYQSQ